MVLPLISILELSHTEASRRYKIICVSDNLALLKPSRMSKLHVGYENEQADKANDGNPDPHFFSANGHSCCTTHPDDDGRVWWQVDILRPCWITSIKIAHRGDTARE